MSQGSRWRQRQRRPRVPRDISGWSPSSGGGSSDWGSDQSAQCSTASRVSEEENWPAWPGAGLRVVGNCKYSARGLPCHCRGCHRGEDQSQGPMSAESEGQSANLQQWEDQRCGDLPFVAVGHSHILPLGMGWLKSIAVCYPVIAGVPGRLGQEFRRECYPTRYSLDFRWELWHGDDVWCLEQGALLPQQDQEKMWPNLGCNCDSRSGYCNQSIWGRSKRSMWRKWRRITSTKAWTLNTNEC